MRRFSLAVLFLVSALSAAPAMAASFDNPAFVPPEDKPVLSVEYWREQQKFRAKESAGFPSLNFVSNHLYAVLSLSGSEGGEVFMKVGARDLRLKNAFADGSDLSDSYKLSGGIGLKQAYFIGKDWKIGGSVQYMISQSFNQTKSITVSGTPASESVVVRAPWEIDAALAFSYIGPWYAPYLGPYFTYKRFKVETSSPTLAAGAAHYSQIGNAGGVAGIEIFHGDFKADFEAQISKETSFGASVSYLFE
jgi:hypothetical protein